MPNYTTIYKTHEYFRESFPYILEYRKFLGSQCIREIYRKSHLGAVMSPIVDQPKRSDPPKYTKFSRETHINH